MVRFAALLAVKKTLSRTPGSPAVPPVAAFLQLFVVTASHSPLVPPVQNTLLIVSISTLIRISVPVLLKVRLYGVPPTMRPLVTSERLAAPVMAVPEDMIVYKPVVSALAVIWLNAGESGTGGVLGESPVTVDPSTR